ncbi:ROK family protein [Flagellimonas sp. CMM7]|uniref:ROK family protein n=1 Tax=Flagellimonas sp. CMM7 TaxID=2654676 RepID=UPI0013D2D489|nr:ROK family protein [Flagellimonas sp. CMM7]UII79971.1 ROK family protein [Flagellimonas sp. CMM7]
MEVLGVDIGGTNINAGIVKDGLITNQSYVSVNAEDSEAQTLERLFNCIDELITHDTQAIGIGVPAIVDVSKGIVYDVQNIPAWKEVHLIDILEKKYNISVHINNDANCFAMGEKLYGKGRKHQNFVGLSIGTGLGMGIIINNEIYNGILSGAGEIGMIGYKEGILEEYTSSFFFMRNYGLSAKEIHDKAKQGDDLALTAFSEFGKHLGEAIKTILYLFAPEAIILGGSIRKAYPFFKESMNQKINSFAYPEQIKSLKIEVSELAESAILGAASLCFQKLEVTT